MNFILYSEKFIMTKSKIGQTWCLKSLSDNKVQIFYKINNQLSQLLNIFLYH